MDQMLKKIPVPITGLMLGLAAAGNLIQSYGEIFRNIFGLISAVLLVLMIVKIIKYPRVVAESLDNPVIASVFPTLSMGIMLLSTYLKPFTATLAFIMWIIGLVLHIFLIMWFTKKYVFGINIKQVFPSWFVVFVGIAVASVTGPSYKMTSIGQSAFWFGFIAYLILLPTIFYRVLKVKDIPKPALPTMAIFAAPASLLLAGYMNSFQSKNIIVVWLLIALSVFMYISVIFMLFKLLKLKFYPSYSGFTFPLVISGIAMKLTNGFMIKSGQTIPSLKYLIKFQEFVGVAITLYVLIRYIQFVFSKEKITSK